jgi:hypothetical protein
MGSPVKVTGVDFATVFVKDFPAAVEFYGGVLVSSTRSTTRKSPVASSRPGA